MLRSLCVLAALLGSEPPPWLEQRLGRDTGLRRLRAALAHALLTLRDLVPFALLYVLVTAVLGVLVFSSAATASPVAATSFGTFPAALLTSFALLTGANTWQRSMWGAMSATGAPAAALFFVLQQLGSMLFLCLVTAALVRSFSVEEDSVRTRAVARVAFAAAVHRTLTMQRCFLQAMADETDDAAVLHEADLAIDPLVRQSVLWITPAAHCLTAFMPLAGCVYRRAHRRCEAARRRARAEAHACRAEHRQQDSRAHRF